MLHGTLDEIKALLKFSKPIIIRLRAWAKAHPHLWPKPGPDPWNGQT